MVPEGWSEKTFNDLLDAGDLASIQDGNHGDIHPKAADFVPDGVPFVMARDLKGGTIDFSGCSFITQVQSDSLRIGHAFPGDVLISHKGTIGNVAVVPDIYEMVMLTPQVTLYRASSGGRIDSKYLRAFLQSERYQARFLALAFQSTRNYLGITQQKKFSVPLPPLPEQRKIADILSTWDRAIETTEALLATARTQKRALMQSLLTGKRRFPEFKGQEWKEVRLGELGTFKKGKGLPKNEVGAEGRFSCVLYGELYTKYGEVIRCPVSRTDLDDGVVGESGDVLIPASTTTSGIDLAIAACVIDGGVRLGGDINIFRRNSDEIDGSFLAYFLTHVRRHEMARFAQGITIVHLKGSDLLDIIVLIPPRNEQIKIMDLVHDVEVEIEHQARQITKLRNEKKALMQQLLTGKRRVVV